MCQIGNVLRKLRLESGYTENKLAGFLGVKESVILEWEENVCEPDLSDCAILCELYGISFESMLASVDIVNLVDKDLQIEFKHESWLNRLSNKCYL